MFSHGNGPFSNGPFRPAFSQLFLQLFRFKNGLCTHFCDLSTNTYRKITIAIVEQIVEKIVEKKSQSEWTIKPVIPIQV